MAPKRLIRFWGDEESPRAGMSGQEQTLKMMRGVMRRPTRAGPRAPLSHVTQGLLMATPISEASFRHNKFWAAAVKNIAEECTEP